MKDKPIVTVWYARGWAVVRADSLLDALDLVRKQHPMAHPLAVSYGSTVIDCEKYPKAAQALRAAAYRLVGDRLGGCHTVAARA